METCNCLPCQVVEKYRALGVPESVTGFYYLNIFKLEALEEKDFAESLEAQLVYWIRLRDAANEMIDKGLITDEEFMRCVVSRDPCESSNMFTRITDYIKSQAH